MSIRLNASVLWMVAVALLTSCSHEPDATRATPAFTDAEGHPVTLTSLPVKRIVSTMQSATEWLMALGATDVLVSRTDYDRQPELAKLPSIGGGLDPSPEAVAALHPDVVLGWRNRSSVDLQHALVPFKIPVISLETADTADMFRHLASLGVLVGKAAQADSLAKQIRGNLASIKRGACTAGDTTPPPTVMVILWTSPPQTAGSGTWMNTLLETACLRNAFGDLAEPWPAVAMEAVIARQPDWLLTSIGAPGQRLSELRALPGWKDLKAVREGRVMEIPGDLLSRAGPTIVDAARAIVAAKKSVMGDR